MIYFFDGTKTGFLTAFLEAYRDDDAFLTSKNAQLVLGQKTVFIEGNEQKAQKAEARLLAYDNRCMDDLDFLLRCGDAGSTQCAYRYFKLLASNKSPVREMLSEPEVIGATERIRKVSYEIHRMHGFVRFMESESGALYAPLSPDNDICDLIAPHFCARLKNFPFVLHDVKRKKAVVYDGKHTFLAPLDKAEIVLSAKENEWQSLWKKYYASVNIPSRQRLKQMRGYMPVRYWKFMPEFH